MQTIGQLHHFASFVHSGCVNRQNQTGRPVSGRCKQHDNLLLVAQSLQKVGACPTDDIEAMTDAIVCESICVSGKAK